MKKKTIRITDIICFLGESVQQVDGLPGDAVIDNLADADHVIETSLDWVKSSAYSQMYAEASIAKVLLVGQDVIFSPVMEEQGKILIHVKNPKRALAQVGNHFFVEHPSAGIHPTAFIDSDANIGEGVYVGEYAVIGKSTIGDRCCIDSYVRIYDDVTIGSNCYIKAGAVLGGAGFGFERDEDGNKFRFPQIGGLIIGNYVEIGANTCIDRGALSDTIIGDYTKINNLCHIAHNNRIGRNVTITGCVNISGSNVISDNVWIAPNACIRGFIHLGEGCTVGMGAVVTKDIPSGETWVGNPARKIEKK